MKIIEKNVQYEIKSRVAQIDGEEREIFDVVISSGAIDQAGDIMNLDGADLSLFDLTKSVFYNHDTMKFPVAKCLGIQRVGDKLVAQTWFHEKTEESRTVKELIKSGVINCASIGFEVLDYYTRPLTEEEKVRVPKASEATVYDKWKLIEYSIVPIPMNSDAVVLRQKSGRVLSKTNESRLRQAIELINEVLASAEQNTSEDELSKQLVEANLEIVHLREELEKLKKKQPKLKLTL